MAIKNHSCPNCQTSETINFFNWRLAQDPKDENHRFVTNIVPVKNLKFGEIYQSVCCGSKWYLHDGIFLYLINPLRQIILDEWTSRDLQVADKFKPILASIGANSKHGMFSVQEYPCEVEFGNKTRSEFAIINLVTLPPDFEEAIYGSRSKSYSFVDEVINVKASRFALPLQIRKETMNPSEVGMGGYSPIPVSDAHGNVFNLSPFENFTDPKLDEPVRILDFKKSLSANPVALQKMPVHQVIADPF